MDIALQWNAALGRADWAVNAGDLALGADIESAVLLSLFTDARAQGGFVPPDGDARGWWGDTYEASPLGSQLWTLGYAPVGNWTALLARARDICIAALEWLVTDGIVATLTVQTARLGAQGIAILVALTEPGGARHNFAYAWAWQRIAPSAKLPVPDFLVDPQGRLLTDTYGAPLQA